MHARVRTCVSPFWDCACCSMCKLRVFDDIFEVCGSGCDTDLKSCQLWMDTLNFPFGTTHQALWFGVYPQRNFFWGATPERILFGYSSIDQNTAVQLVTTSLCRLGMFRLIRNYLSGDDCCEGCSVPILNEL